MHVDLMLYIMHGHKKAKINLIVFYYSEGFNHYERLKIFPNVKVLHIYIATANKQ